MSDKSWLIRAFERPGFTAAAIVLLMSVLFLFLWMTEVENAKVLTDFIQQMSGRAP